MGPRTADNLAPRRLTALATIVVMLTAGLVSTALVAPSSSAVGTTTTTSGVKGSTANGLALLWYDDGYADPLVTPPDGSSEVTLTATPTVGHRIDFTLTLVRGPHTSELSPLAADRYQLDAFVRLDGASHTRGTRFDGPVGHVDVAENTATFAGGVRISGSFNHVPRGMHRLTLTDVLLDVRDTGGKFGPPFRGFDVAYNGGRTTTEILGPSADPLRAGATGSRDWGLWDTAQIGQPTDTGPRVKIKVPNPHRATRGAVWRKVRGTVRDPGSVVTAVTIKVTGHHLHKTVRVKPRGTKFVAKIGTVEQGRLKLRYWAADKAGRRSPVGVVRARITR